MGYNELIKNFNKIRDYMREFYVFGFKSRDEFNKKSARSYDDERRRMESLLGDYYRFRQTQEGKSVFLSIDSRITNHNPLYKAWKAKSFTDGDITLHFILLDILISKKSGLTSSEINNNLYDYLCDDNKVYDESTIRKKLKEYEQMGLVYSKKDGKKVLYFLSEIKEIDKYVDLLNFYSEVAPCGVIGSFLLDKIDDKRDDFAFKHHYITGALDSEILCSLFEAMGEKRSITLETINRYKDKISENHVVPVRIRVSVQSGRQYLMAFVPRLNRISSFRIDNIVSVKIDEKSNKFDLCRENLDKMEQHIWGVSTSSFYNSREMEHVDFTIKYNDNERYIYKRLLREKRCGIVKEIDKNTAMFSAELYDSMEIIPWLRTFICRISEIHFSNENVANYFREDLLKMYKQYEVEDYGV